LSELDPVFASEGQHGQMVHVELAVVKKKLHDGVLLKSLDAIYRHERLMRMLCHPTIVIQIKPMRVSHLPEVTPLSFAQSALLRLEDELSRRGIGSHNVCFPNLDDGGSSPKGVVAVDLEIREADRRLPLSDIEARFLAPCVAVLANEIESRYDPRKGPFRCQPIELPPGTLPWSELVTSKRLAVRVLAQIKLTKRGTARKRRPFPYQIRIEVAQAQ
jgi:hypothetical protein